MCNIKDKKSGGDQLENGDLGMT